VAIIPYTFEHTNMSSLKKADMVNIEWDVVGKYVARIQSLK
jgi:riboflavin synthase